MLKLNTCLGTGINNMHLCKETYLNWSVKQELQRYPLGTPSLPIM